MHVASFDQVGKWEYPLEVAARIGITGMDIKNLKIYYYDKAQNSYSLISDSSYWVDKNGYLHFNTAYAGDIVISDRALTLSEK